MLYNLMLKLNAILAGKEIVEVVEYKKDNDIYINGTLIYTIDETSDEYGKVYIDVDGYQTYSFCMHNTDGERNVRCHYLKEAEVMELFYRAVHKDLELYSY